VTPAERDEAATALHQRATTVLEIADLEQVRAMEWDSNSGQVTGVETGGWDDDAADELAAVVRAIRAAANAQREYARKLRTIARQYADGVRS
jgi:hypothetical protein